MDNHNSKNRLSHKGFIFRTLFWFFVLISTNLLVGWSAYHWKDALVKRSLDSLLVRASTVDRENRELQDIVSDLRKKNDDFTVMIKPSPGEKDGSRITVQSKFGGSFALRVPESWGLVGVSGIQFATEGATQKIVGGFLLTPEYTENIDLPYDPTIVLWVVKSEYKNDSGVRAVAGDFVTENGQFAYFGQVRINDKRECKSNDKICRETLTKVSSETEEVWRSFVPLTGAGDYVR